MGEPSDPVGPSTDPSNEPSNEAPTEALTEAPKLGARRLLIGIGVAMVVLCGVFGYTTLRQRGSYRAYSQRTTNPEALPWTHDTLDVDACVEFSVEWGMACPAVESWCLSESPRLLLECMKSADRTAYCEEQGEAVLATSFGYDACESMRSEVEGRYTQRAHKKFCAASYRAVAEHCRQADMP